MQRLIIALTGIAMLLFAAINSAHAQSVCDQYCGLRLTSAHVPHPSRALRRQGRAVRSPHRTARAYSDANGNDTQIIGGRHAGCPHAYCGCGLRKYLGLSDVRLDLAWNWARLFPHESAPRAGLAAVRHHHVMYIEAAVGNGLFLIRDYNSGGGLSRLHIRDVRGYVFVRPVNHSAMN